MYELIADNYSSIFPLDIDTIDFIDSYLDKKHNSSILDIGCATGDLAVALSNKGYSVFGIDFDAKMIEIALSKVTNSLLRFKQANMLTLDQTSKYDCILCLGNTMPHVSSWEELNHFIKLLYTILNNNGILIIQNLNYDKVINDGNIVFQTKEGKDFIFKRRYTNISINTITFEIEIYDKRTLQMYTDSTKLLPIEKRRLLELLEKNGFEEAEVFSDYNGSAASENDYYNVFVVQKKI